MKVLVILEDFRKDQFVIKPILEAMFKGLGKPNASIEICRDPLLGGVQKALKWTNQLEIINLYKYKIDLFLLCVDRDNDMEREAELRNLEKLAATELAKNSKKKSFMAVQAEQELEVWLLAGHDLPKTWVWKEIRAERNPKEKYFEVFAEKRGFITNLDEARVELSKGTGNRYERIKQFCPEVADLEKRIRVWIEN